MNPITWAVTLLMTGLAMNDVWGDEVSKPIKVDHLHQHRPHLTQLEAEPPVYLRGCGVPEDFITYLPSLIGTRPQ